MNRGTVMEIAGKTAVVMTRDGEFIQVRTRRETGLGEEITWAETDRIRSKRKSAAAIGRHWIFSGVSAAVLLILCTALWSFRAPTVVAYVSMDINPSVEFGLDAKERVRELRAVNEDALPLIEGVSFKGQPIEKVMQNLAGKLRESHILAADGGEIVIASVRLHNVDEHWEAKVTEKIKQALQQASTGTDPVAGHTSRLTIETLFLPVEVRDEAEENDISAGKMAFWLAAENSGREVAMEELRNDSVKVIASSGGGLKKVLDEGKIDKEDKESWKKLLSEKKEKLVKQKDDRKKSPKPSGGKVDQAGKQEPSASTGGKDDDRDDGQQQDSVDDGLNGSDDGKDKDKDKDKDKNTDKDKNKNKDKNKDEGNDGQKLSGYLESGKPVRVSPDSDQSGRDDDERGNLGKERNKQRKEEQEKDRNQDRGKNGDKVRDNDPQRP